MYINLNNSEFEFIYYHNHGFVIAALVFINAVAVERIKVLEAPHVFKQWKSPDK